MPTTPSDQYEYLTQTVDTLLPEGELLTRLEEGRPLRVKLGVDPTAPDVHLGWAVVFDLLRRFQELGHTAVLIIGDFTAQVGDPSGQSGTRQRLGAEEVEAYAARSLDTIAELLLPEPLEIRRNSEWLASLDMNGLLDLTSKVTVARIMDREDFSGRFQAQEPISLIEFLYPLLQGMDSVAVQADVEIGGSDQLWNLLVGRDLQERYGQRGQLVMTVPLLVGTDGTRKMSQSFANYISVKDSSDEMFGKVMSIPDELMAQWFLLAGGASRQEVEELEQALEQQVRHPGEAKRQLGRAIVERYWGEKAARDAEAAFDRVFVEGKTPDEVPAFTLEGKGSQYLPGLLEAAGLVSSRSEARRLIEQGAVSVDGEQITVDEIDAAALVGRVIRVGKRRFVRIEPAEGT